MRGGGLLPASPLMYGEAVVCKIACSSTKAMERVQWEWNRAEGESWATTLIYIVHAAKGGMCPRRLFARAPPPLPHRLLRRIVECARMPPRPVMRISVRKTKTMTATIPIPIALQLRNPCSSGIPGRNRVKGFTYVKK